MKILKTSIFWLMFGMIWAGSSVVADSSNSPSDQQRGFSKLLQEVLKSEDNKNVVYSPISVSIILFLLATATPDSRVQNELGSLHPYNSRTDGARSIRSFLNRIENDSQQQINLETKIFSRNINSILQNYTNQASFLFHTVFEDLNSKTAADINSWVEKVTKGNLKTLLTPDELAEIKLLLVNVLFFHGKWLKPFADETITKKFTLNNGNKVDVDYMFQDDTLSYYEADDLKILELPYVGGKYYMTILVPNPGGLMNLISKISPHQLSDWQSRMKLQKVLVYLPKFSFSSQIDVKDMIHKSIGNTTIFRGNSGFPYLGNSNISQIYQKAGISVDQFETTAFATSFEIEPISADYKDFKADRPFLFLIQENGSGEIIFAGKVNDPRLLE